MGRSALARLFVEMQFRDKGVDKGLRSAQTEATKAAGAFGKLGGAMKKVGAIAGGFIVANVIQRGLSAVVGSIGSVINAGSDMAESASKAATVFGAGYGEIEKAAKGAAFAVGLSKGEYLEAAGTLGNLLKGVGVATSELPGMSKAIITAAGDLGSFNNVDPGQVLEDLRSGLVGEAEPLRKYGILINEAAMKTKALEMGIGGANGEMTEGEKVQVRYALIMDQLGDANGDFAKTQFGLANGTRILKALFGNFQIWLGGKLAPTIGRIVKRINQFIKAFTDLHEKGISPVSAAFMALRQLLTGGKDSPTKWSKLTERFEAALLRVASYWDDLVAVVKVGGRIFMAVLGFIVRHFDVIGPAVLGAVVALKLFALAQKAVAIASALMALSLSPLIIVLLAIAAIGALFAIAWVKDWFGIRDKTKAVIDAVLGFLRPLIDGIIEVGKYFYDVATGKIQPLGAALEAMPGWLQPIVYVLARVIKTVRVFFKTWADKGIMAALAKMPAQIRQFGRAIAGVFDKLGLGRTADMIKKTFADLASLFKNVVSLIDNLVHGRWAAVWTDLKNIAVDLFNLFLDRFRLVGALLLDIFELIPWQRIGFAILNGLIAAGTYMETTGYPWLWQMTKRLFGAITGALVEWWETSALPWLADLGNQVVAGVGDVSETLAKKGRALIRGLHTGARGWWNETVFPWIKGIPGKIGDVFDGLYDAAKGWGEGLINGFSAGISSVWHKLTGWIDKIIGELGRIPDWLKPGSPSKTMTVFGKSAPWGLAAGIDKGMPLLEDAMGRMVATMGGAARPSAATANASGATPRPGSMGGAWRVNQFGERAIVVELRGGDRAAANAAAHWILREIDNLEAGRLS